MTGKGKPTREQQLRRAIQLSGLPDGEVRLFVVLLDGAQFGTAVILPEFAPSVPKLMTLTGKSRATVFRRLAHLERHGWLVPPAKSARGRNARIVRVLQVGERCECPPQGGNRRRPLGATKPTPAGRVSPSQPTQSHLGERKSLTLKDVSAGQRQDSGYGSATRERGRDGTRHDRLLATWPVGTNGWEANRVSGPTTRDTP
jgi:IclR-like helix-turn-helix domain-containing protein